MKKLMLAVALLVVVTLLPIYPQGTVEPSDPTSATDRRVIAPISDSDLEEVLRLVRRPKWGGFWPLAFRLGKGLPVLSVASTHQSREFVRSEVVVHPPVGELEVAVGRVVSALRGSGYKFVLDKVDGKWVLLEKSRWFT